MVMYIRNKPAAACYKLLLGMISLVLTWYLLSQYGFSAFRLFPTWVLLLSALYFLINASILALNVRKFTGKNSLPIVEGVLILAFWLMCGVSCASAQYHFYLPPLDGWLVWLLCLVLPILTTLDWALFVQKGRWRAMMPFYGLVLPVSYMATMMFTADFLPSTTEFRYPLEMFNVWEFGLWPMLSYAVATATLIVIAGYILYILDFALSGKLAKYVVLPHLRVIEIDANGQEVIIQPVSQKTKPTKASTAPARPKTKPKSKTKTAKAKPSTAS